MQSPPRASRRGNRRCALSAHTESIPTDTISIVSLQSSIMLSSMAHAPARDAAVKRAGAVADGCLLHLPHGKRELCAGARAPVFAP